jgi:hypothetical protein
MVGSKVKNEIIPIFFAWDVPLMNRMAKPSKMKLSA